MCVSTVIGELWGIFAQLFLAAEMAFVCLVREYDNKDSSSNNFKIVSPVQGELFEEKERGWQRRMWGRKKEGTKVQHFLLFFLVSKKAFQVYLCLLWFYLVLLILQSRVTCSNFKTVRFIYHLFRKPLN